MTYATEHAAAVEQIERSVNRVFELAAELAANVKPRTNLAKAMTAMSLFVGLPKGAAYADDFNVVAWCLNEGVLDADVIELGLVAAGFIRN